MPKKKILSFSLLLISGLSSNLLNPEVRGSGFRLSCNQSPLNSPCCRQLGRLEAAQTEAPGRSVSGIPVLSLTGGVTQDCPDVSTENSSVLGKSSFWVNPK